MDTCGKIYTGTNPNSIRVVKKFLWKPTKINKTSKWLCVCYIKQKYTQIPFVFWDFEWKDLEFLTQSEYIEYRIINE
jgi:hypothetical protein